MTMIMGISSYRSIGNSLHGLNLLNIFLYGSLLYMYGTDPNSNVFDKSWLQEGFCTPHPNVDYFTTHDLSGYAMVVIALLGIALVLALRSTSNGQHPLSINNNNNKTNELIQAENLAFWAMIGALGHASGHFLISNAKRMKFYPPPETTFLEDLLQSSIPLAIGKAYPGYPLFWMPLVRTYMMNTARGRVAIVAFFCWIGSFFLQSRFGFSYTQCVLFAGLSIDQLQLPRNEKGFAYALWPLLTTIPNGIFAWMESLTCSSSSVMIEHGHLIYDIYMASSYIIFYLICWLRFNNNYYYYDTRSSTTIKPKSL